MSRSVFLDTGYVLALELKNDQNHRVTRDHWGRQRVASLPSLLTTSFVFDEVVTFLNARGHHERAVEVGERLLSSPSVELVHVGEELLRRGFDYLRRHQDKRYSLTDCVSFVVMSERGVMEAFALDDHFERAGFRKEP